MAIPEIRSPHGDGTRPRDHAAIPAHLLNEGRSGYTAASLAGRSATNDSLLGAAEPNTLYICNAKPRHATPRLTVACLRPTCVRYRAKLAELCSESGVAVGRPAGSWSGRDLVGTPSCKYGCGGG